MSTLPRFGFAASAIALAAMLSGCATPTSRVASAVKSGSPDFAPATRAQVALAGGDFQTAVELAERAVESSPEDATVRTLLGNAYFAAGRFASAEAAYRDSLSLIPNQPQLMLKLALVQIAQGKRAEALAFLGSARPALDAADYGLAVALAGQTDDAVAVLESAARRPGADARVRQNLALAHGLAGNWEMARIVASQDLAADMVDSRIQQWMGLAQPVRASDQVATLVGVTPAAADPGQPVRLALQDGGTQLAAAEPLPQTAPPASQPAPMAFAEVPQSVPVGPLAEALVPPQPVMADVAPAYVPPAVAAFEPKRAESAPTPAAAAALAAERKPAKVTPAAAPNTKPALASRGGKSGVVVQLGAYSSPDRVSVAWEKLAGRYPALRDYSPVRARFDGPRGTVWRLSIRGFDSQQEAIERCKALRSRGGNCFVRPTAGDSPVQFASR